MSAKQKLTGAITQWRNKAKREPQSRVARALHNAEQAYKEALEDGTEPYMNLIAGYLAHQYTVEHEPIASPK